MNKFGAKYTKILTIVALLSYYSSIKNAFSKYYLCQNN